ncbi:YceI family protein [Rhodothermus marinus]|uniref:YceI family protein n=1 Tax=Rhodothermus marinus TaxID=29549 RepID=UPI001DE262E5|nr:YceI family protein [Rhodothermus marinus]MBO2491301.1 YceI family protein [Rhodothermus marinus]
MQRFSTLWLLLGLLVGGLNAQPITVAVDSTESILQYHGHHPLHGWTGTSRSVHGTLRLDLSDPADPARSVVTIRVPVASFDSGNSNRDANMLDAVEADRYPDVLFESTAISVQRWERTASGYEGSWTVGGNLTFHGQTHPVTIPVTVRIEGNCFEATGAFSIALSQFEVRRPKLLLWSIRDTIDLEGTIRATLPDSAVSRR